MQYSITFYSVALLVIFFLITVLATLLFVKSKNRPDDSGRLLSAFLVLGCLYFAPWMLGYAGWYIFEPYRTFMFYVPFQNLYALGPLVLLYVQKQFPTPHLPTFSKLHFLPAVLYALFALWMFTSDLVLRNEPQFYGDGWDRELDSWYQISGFVSICIYLICSIRHVFKFKNSVENVVSFVEELRIKWITQFLLILTVIQVGKLFYLIFFPDYTFYFIHGYYYLVFAVLLLLIAVKAYLFRNQVLLLGIQALRDEIVRTETIENTTLVNRQQFEAFDNLVNQHLLFLDERATLPILAQKLQTNSTYLSAAINQHSGFNFNDYINAKRITHFKNQVMQGKTTEFTFLGLALECGFSSKSTFNRVFKKHTGLTPSQFVAQTITKSSAKS
ncbi:helix-turn-helix domain-containing protein [Flavobacterium sp.]|uniref:helix-turn-helix domain-containing protein n=1 Tax=Flavobacterium sp. TaxID=239 RepID=UPI0026365115|nr:helix-turn-helix domain-containing protein [Flavobacterium sp.]